MTLGRSLVNVSLPAAIIVSAVGGVMVIMPPATSERPTAPPEVVVGELLLTEHASDCWQAGDKPLAELPGAAIVQLSSGDVIYTTRHRLVDEAFAEALAEAGYGDRVSDRLDPVALCV